MVYNKHSTDEAPLSVFDKIQSLPVDVAGESEGEGWWAALLLQKFFRVLRLSEGAAEEISVSLEGLQKGKKKTSRRARKWFSEASLELYQVEVSLFVFVFIAPAKRKQNKKRNDMQAGRLQRERSTGLAKHRSRLGGFHMAGERHLRRRLSTQSDGSTRLQRNTSTLTHPHTYIQTYASRRLLRRPVGVDFPCRLMSVWEWKRENLRKRN